MVIYDLICDSGHEFEGWFKNPDDLKSQQSTGLLCCPYCDSGDVNKKLTAPKLTKKSNASSSPSVVAEQTLVAGNGSASSSSPAAGSSSTSPAAYAKLQKMLGEVHSFIENNFEDVGNRFADEAIMIHKGEKDPANIRGTASATQLKELADEGVTAVALPAKPVDKKKLN